MVKQFAQVLCTVCLGLVVLQPRLASNEQSRDAVARPAGRPASLVEAVTPLGSWVRITEQAAFQPRDTAEDLVFQGKIWLSNGYNGSTEPPFRDLWTSTDGATWTLVDDHTPYDDYSELVWYDNKMWAIKSSVWSSPDGATWTPVSPLTPFGYRGSGEVVVFKGKMWQLGSGEDVWYSSDGVNWTCATSQAPFGLRFGAGVVVFDDKLWVIGGWMDQPGDPPGTRYPWISGVNDVWNSSDGVTWNLVQTQAPWQPRMWFTTKVYAGRIWIIGGFDNVEDENFDDIWSTRDGRKWERMDSGGISARHESTAFVYDESLWLVAGNSWPLLNDVWRFSLSPPSGLDERLSIGLGPFAGDGGWIATRKGAAGNFNPAAWIELPWPAYSASGGGLRLSAGDVDGDGLDEIVAGLGPGGAGWMAIFDDAAHGYALLRWVQVEWPTYNGTNGEVWPAVGDLDGDGRAEIVAGLGHGSQGYFQIFADAANDYASIGWRQVAWPAYTAGANGSTHPAIANVDGVGASEIVVGLGGGSGGWIAVFSGLGGQSWIRAGWDSYNTSNGTTFPAAGDLDGDGGAEIVIGFGDGGGGWLEVLDDANAGYAHVSWLRTSWDVYNLFSSGATHPAVGNVDSDGLSEIVIGLGPYGPDGGWVEICDDSVAGYANISWQNTGWTAYQSSGGGTFPAVGKFK